jgi:hypothetical protein
MPGAANDRPASAARIGRGPLPPSCRFHTASTLRILPRELRVGPLRKPG